MNDRRMKTIIFFACALFALNGTADLIFMVTPSVWGFTDYGLRYVFSLGKASLVEGVIVYLALRMSRDVPAGAWLFNLIAGSGLLALSFLAQRIDSAMFRDTIDSMDGLSKFVLDWVISGVPVILLAIMFYSDAFANRDNSSPEHNPEQKKTKGNDFAKNLLSGVIPTTPEHPKANPPRQQKQSAEADIQPK